MWRTIRKELQTGQSDQYHIVADDGSIMSYAQVVECWGRDPDFAGYFSSQLAASVFEAFLWETPPVSRASLHRPFEYVLIDSPVLAGALPDETAFAEYFEAGSAEQRIVSFDNLGGDARLVSPCPLRPLAACTHLAAFVRDAPAAAVVQLWQKVSASITNALNDQPLWVSTCGLGVYWLHVRLDSYPKYYRHTPYQSPR